jgi:outer membrane biosynthesis protein TonB
VISSSRQPVLDQAALGMVKRLGSLPPPPEPSPLRFPARIQYRLDEQ